jgi:hypothetical protein
VPKRRADPTPQLEAVEAADDCAGLAAGLGSNHARVVARAAELAGERLCYDLEGALIAAFRRLCALDHKRDPGCTAKGAVTRTLVTLACLDAEVFREGLVLRQPEPVWGGTVDTAVDVRSSCAMGLAASGDPRALIDLVGLLADPEHRARSGAARAIACTQPLAAEAVLRLKVLGGDAEAEVVGECLRCLLELAPATAPEFVAGRLEHWSVLARRGGRALDMTGSAPAQAAELAQLAALALGESRLDAAVALLRRRWEAAPLHRDEDRILLQAAVLARTDAAFDWLLELVATADGATAAFIVEALAVYRGNRALAERLAAAVSPRREAVLQAALEAAWAGRSGHVPRGSADG